MEVGMGEHKERTHLQTADASADPDRRRRGGGGALEALRRRQQRSAGGQSNGPIGGQTVKMVKMVKTVKHGRSNSLKSGSRQVVERAEPVMSGSDWSNERERGSDWSNESKWSNRSNRSNRSKRTTTGKDRSNGPNQSDGPNRPIWSKPAGRGRTCADA